MINRLAIIGVGLIGGSLALALKKANQVQHVIGCGRSKANLETAVKKDIIDEYTYSVAESIKNADMIFLSVPLGAMKDVLTEIKPHLTEQMVITDGGSAKQSLINDCSEVFGFVPENFVPGHPIAGTENSGAEAAFAELYQQRRIILTPRKNVSPHALNVVRDMWQQCGAVVSEMTVEHHDQVLAATSHLPHMLAFALVDMLANLNENDEIFRYAAGGFRDFTRIASSNPVMWRDICLANETALENMLGKYIDTLVHLRKMLGDKDSEQLEKVFVSAKQARDNYVDSVK